jgi:hypothetical protein
LMLVVIILALSVRVFMILSSRSFDTLNRAGKKVQRTAAKSGVIAAGTTPHGRDQEKWTNQARSSIYCSYPFVLSHLPSPHIVSPQLDLAPIRIPVTSRTKHRGSLVVIFALQARVRHYFAIVYPPHSGFAPASENPRPVEPRREYGRFATTRSTRLGC